MKTQAAVLWQPGQLEILEVELAPPREREVLVRIASCGVCASDLHVLDGELPEPMPLVLGHEAAGVVDAVGRGSDAAGVVTLTVTVSGTVVNFSRIALQVPALGLPTPIVSGAPAESPGPAIPVPVGSTRRMS